jgi:hypothetical protein
MAMSLTFRLALQLATAVALGGCSSSHLENDFKPIYLTCKFYSGFSAHPYKYIKNIEIYQNKILLKESANVYFTYQNTNEYSSIGCTDRYFAAKDDMGKVTGAAIRCNTSLAFQMLPNAAPNKRHLVAITLIYNGLSLNSMFSCY